MGRGRAVKHSNTPFELKWGERADAIAEREQVDTATIHMRIMNYGSPYQRKAKPTKWERKYWKTAKELCVEFNLHLQTLEQREKNHGTLYCEENTEFVIRNRPYSEPDMTPVAHQRPWLMTEHPDYVKWRSGVMFPEDA